MIGASKQMLQAALDSVCDGRTTRAVDPYRLHSFPARMPSIIAEKLIEQITHRESVILDPMMGAGTTLIAARKLGRMAIGLDLDPLAVILTRGALTLTSTERLEAVASEILCEAKQAARSARDTKGILDLGPDELAFINYWFPPSSSRQLAALARTIRGLGSRNLKDFFWTIFSNIIIVKAAGPSLALDLARSRPHRVLDKPVVLPFDVWLKRAQYAIERVESLRTGAFPAKCVPQCGDARKLPLPNGSVNCVITSPPYLHAVDYIRAHKFALVWMGADLDHLRSVRSQMIGTERGLYFQDGLPNSLESRIKKSTRSTEPKVRRYLHDLNLVLREMYRVLSPKGLVVLVTGDAILSASRRDASKVLTLLAESVGFRAMATETRTISSRRRSLPPPHVVSGSNSLSKRFRTEMFLALQK
jgi:DNA modification methylase